MTQKALSAQILEDDDNNRTTEDLKRVFMFGEIKQKVEVLERTIWQWKKHKDHNSQKVSS